MGESKGDSPMPYITEFKAAVHIHLCDTCGNKSECDAYCDINPNGPDKLINQCWAYCTESTRHNYYRRERDGVFVEAIPW